MEVIKKTKNKKYNKIISKNNTNTKIFSLLTKTMITVIITLICLIGCKKSTNFKSKFYEKIYEENFSFAKINNLYQKYFGSLLPFENKLNNSTEPVFSETFTYLSKEKYLDGEKFTVDNNYLMPVLESGMVVFIGEKEEYGNTIIIQQVDGVDTWYSNINSNIKLYDYIEKGDVLGEVNSNYLYLVMKKDGKYLTYEN